VAWGWKSVLLSAILLGAPQGPTGARRFKGTIGDGLAIVVEIEKKDDGTLAGHYAYVKHKKPIGVAGTIDDAGRVVLTETDAAGKRTGEFNGTMKETGFAGMWSSADGKKKLPFSLNELRIVTSIGGGFRVVPIDIDAAQKRYLVHGEIPAIEGLADENAMEAFNAMVRAKIDPILKDFARAARDVRDDAAMTSELDVGYVAAGLGAQWVSVDITVSTSLAQAAHPSVGQIALNLDLLKLKPLKLASVFKPKAPYKKRLTKLAVREISRQLDETSDRSWVTEIAKNWQAWNLTSQGLGLNYDRQGPFPGLSIVVPWKDLIDLVDPDGPAGTFVKS
jgi:hypothetical protein